MEPTRRAHGARRYPISPTGFWRLSVSEVTDESAIRFFPPTVHDDRHQLPLAVKGEPTGQQSRGLVGIRGREHGEVAASRRDH